MRLKIALFSLLVACVNSADAKQVDAQPKKEVSQKKELQQSLSQFGDYHGIPKVLSEKDVQLYRKMFRYQRAGMRDKVVSLLPKLSDGALMGHLVAERLLHPTKRASYKDLQKWLSRYSDHGPSAKIYKLANKRKPKRASHKKPETLKASIARYSNPDNVSVKKDAVQNTSKRKKMLRTLKYYRQKQYYTKSMKVLYKKSTRSLLGEDTWAQVSLRLAQSMSADGYFKKTRNMANKVVTTTKMRRTEALWLAGFSSYMLDEKKKAASYFRRLTYSVPVGSKYFSKGAFWAGKSYEEAGEKNIATVFYNIAARDVDTYYGMLSAQKENQPQKWNWKVIPSIDKKDMKVLYKDKLIRRVIALAQIGEISLAQEELKMLNGRMPYDMDPALLALSVRLGLPNTSMTLGYNMEERGKFYATAVYPVMRNWQPNTGYKVEKSLMHAIARQESAFKPAIKSRAGARGLMQVMPATAKYIRKKMKKPVYTTTALNKPYINLDIGQDYVAYLDEKLEGNLIHMVAAYNAGPGNVRKWKTRNIGNGDPIVFVERIPFKETRYYVQKVMRNYWMYQSRFGEETGALATLSQNKWPTLAKNATISQK